MKKLTHSLWFEGTSYGAMYANKRKSAFTLAEVLITIGIIGVTSAMTLPTLIQKYQKQVTVTSLRKFYSIIAQTKLNSEAMNGEMEYWDFPETRTYENMAAFFDKYFRPYMNVIDQNTWVANNAMSVGWAPVYTLKDGMQFQFAPNCNDSIYSGKYIYIIVDINGNKGPNRDGIDIFYLDIFPKIGTVMLAQTASGGIRYQNRDEIKNGVPINNGRHTACCAESCATPQYKYYACGALIQADGWVIKDDYPW